MPSVSEQQRKAMCAAAHGASTLGIPKHVGEEFCSSDAAAHAAGTLYVAQDGSVLLLKRADDGTWALPAGMREGDEKPLHTATREASEEMGDCSHDAEPARALDRSVNQGGLAFHTFAREARSKFAPTLNDEHTDHRWASLDALPSPLHPGVSATLSDRLGIVADMSPKDWSTLRESLLKFLREEEDEPEHAEHASDVCAMDRASVRSFDQDGHLRIARQPVSKANVCEYYGREIPDADRLGLDENRRYRLLRHPDELRRAADTWNGKPLKTIHVAVGADDHDRENVVGSSGTDAEYEHPYLYTSLAVWDKHAIDGIEGNKRRQLSSSYRYRADMTPGVYEGQPYDGVMRDLSCNHIALVREGRAGPDVIVGDEAIAIDAPWHEDAHPRDLGGQFGAGRGKSHAEHTAHHTQRAREQFESGNNLCGIAHVDAAIAHQAANSSDDLDDVRAAYAASKKAHEATEKKVASDEYDFGAFQMSKPDFSRFSALAQDERPRFDFGAFAADAFEEGKHPRANNGQFGAGEGKSHAEHAAHHDKKTEYHNARAIGEKNGGELSAARAHAIAAGKHADAAYEHGIASKQDGSSGFIFNAEKAHAASKHAHEASEATKPKKEPDVRDQVNEITAQGHRKDSEDHAGQSGYHARRAGEANVAGRGTEGLFHTKAAEAHAAAARAHHNAGQTYHLDSTAKTSMRIAASKEAVEHGRKANEASLVVSRHIDTERAKAEAAAAKKEVGKYGAGPGKSHEEHDAHHAKLAEEHEGQIDKQADPRKALAHLDAASKHHEASWRHRIAGKMNAPEHSENAHRASREAHEASERAKK